eukprot:CAMPEP_0175839510 /NCGR_PEP_ID=MMETSP0107_2-20121207/18850_1 /TAXON_ID=195067 ORGANISM="Goniomonas pacifica, Strain CCMP1869" /NCGR_SAMPLE_ID=MMETSP0107_2 /ASSEMBLY_ACC=CAM_ASM_000203 /LENGTH=144 /DNA_ID=CAMNT_0017153247 /DNA_START=171 /DNA_END=601 /DNA_ORIENTATION=+
MAVGPNETERLEAGERANETSAESSCTSLPSSDIDTVTLTLADSDSVHRDASVYVLEPPSLAASCSSPHLALARCPRPCRGCAGGECGLEPSRQLAPDTMQRLDFFGSGRNCSGDTVSVRADSVSVLRSNGSIRSPNATFKGTT